jgi:hypothetical protein
MSASLFPSVINAGLFWALAFMEILWHGCMILAG